MSPAPRSDVLASCLSAAASSDVSGEVLIVDPIHPDEWMAGRIAEAVEQAATAGVVVVSPDPNWHLNIDPLTGRPSRLIRGENLNRLGKGKPDGTPAEQLVHELGMLAQRFALVVIVHSREDKGQQYAVYSPQANTRARRTAHFLTGELAILGDVKSLAYHFPNVIDLEFDADGPLTVDSFVVSLPRIVADDIPDVHPRAEFRYAAEVTAEQGRALGLPRRLAPFSEVDPEYVRRLGHDPARKLFVNVWDADNYEERTGFWAELLEAV